MRLKRILALSALAAFLVFACSDDDDNTLTPDKGVPKDKGSTDAKDGSSGDGKSGDAASTAPYIDRMIPSDGFANGGKLGKGSTILLTGRNFKQGATVYIDGVPQAMVVSVASAVSMTLVMPKNEYGDTVRMADIMIFVNSEFSNTKTFTYTITKAMTADYKGSVTTTTAVEAYADYDSSSAFDGKVYIKGVTDTETTKSKKIKAEIGFGKAGVNPTDTAGFMWFPATFSKADTTTGYHHYSTKLKVPLATTYNVVYRFSYDAKGLGQFGEYVYADYDETDLKFELTKVATIKATAAPADYCLKSSDCYDSLKVACKVSTSSWKLHKCVPCLAASDCVSNKSAYGNLCNTSTNACYCTADTDCKEKQLGYVCANKSSKGNICGCTKDTNCPVGLKCQKTQSGATICGVPSP